MRGKQRFDLPWFLTFFNTLSYAGARLKPELKLKPYLVRIFSEKNTKFRRKRELKAKMCAFAADCRQDFKEACLKRRRPENCTISGGCSQASSLASALAEDFP
jgi:hypothetical protein